MIKDIAKFTKRVNELQDDHATTNHDRRVLFADIELLKIRLESAKKGSDEERAAQIAELDQLAKKLKLKKVNHYWYDSVDRMVCGVAGWIWLLNATILFSVPTLMIKPIDDFLVRKRIIDSHSQISEQIEKFIANVMLLISGTDLQVVGSDSKIFAGSKCPLVCFSHGSALDTFVMGAVVPLRQNTLAKKELFLIPFLNLLLYTFGGIPIDRNNRNSAVTSIQNAMKNAESGGCIMIAPEGTRSKTGQLLPFKKGPFYIWEDLQSTIVPFLISGAFELCPPGYFMNLPGRVYVHQLAPIVFDPKKNQTRESVSIELRVRMLEAMKKVPIDASAPISPTYRAKNVLAILGLLAFQYWLYEVPCKLIMNLFDISFSQLWLVIFGISLFITLLFFIFKVQLTKYRKPLPRSSSSNQLSTSRSNSTGAAPKEKKKSK